MTSNVIPFRLAGKFGRPAREPDEELAALRSAWQRMTDQQRKAFLTLGETLAKSAHRAEETEP